MGGTLEADVTPKLSERRLKKVSTRTSIVARLVNLFGWGSVFGTLLGFGASQYWIADIAAQFRVQYLCMLLPATALWMSRRRVKPLIVGGLALAVNLWPIIPYFVPPNRPAPTDSGIVRRGESSFRLVVLNVLRTNENFEATLEEVVDENADFIFLMEVQPAWKPQLEKLRDRYPYQKLLCRQDYTGVAFLSRHPWNDLEIVNVDDIGNPPIDITFPRLDSQLAGFRLIATHPLPPFGSRLTNSRDRQLNVLAKRFQSDQAALLVGDFNLTPWSPRFHHVLEAGQLRDASLGYGIRPTLAPLPTLMGGLKVDHVLVNNRVIIGDYRLNSDAHSDHRRLVVDFGIVSH